MTAKSFLLIRGELVQQTAANFGGNGESDWVDHVLCRDGQDRYTLRGETLAGALAATARRMFKDLPKQIGDGGNKQPSVWRVFTSHPEHVQNATIRQNVRIDNQTGAAADGALFDMETLPQQTRWPFILEIDRARAGKEAETVIKVTLHALAAWEKGRCWLGRSVARGTGWFKLEEIHVAEVGWEEWPDSSVDDIAQCFDKKFKNTAQKLADVLRLYPAQADGGWSWLEYRLTLTVGEAKNGYGMGLLSVGGHSGDVLSLDIENDLIDNKRLLLPEAGLNKNVTQTWIADQTFAFERINGIVKPYIPGSSIRGVLRHAAEWWAQKHGIPLADLENVFGNMTDKPKSGALLIQDAHLLKEDWQAVLLKMHAEDEFAGGVYESALFDRLALVKATLETRLVLEAKTTEIAKLEKALYPAFELAQLGFIGLGGQAARGFGQVQWHIEKIEEGQ